VSKIEALVDDFDSMDNTFRLETLLDYAERLPEIPVRYQIKAELEAHRVHECQSPVSLWVEVEADEVRIFAHVPQEAPTVRGFISMLIEGFDGATPAEVLAAPMDILNRSGLAQAIGMRRMFGLSAIYQRIKQEVAAQLG
jgi:cysteine desulfuration protein SufE